MLLRNSSQQTGYGQKHRKGDIVLNLTGLILSILSVITGLWHQADRRMGRRQDPADHLFRVCLHTLRFLCGESGNIRNRAKGFLKEVIKNRQEQKKTNNKPQPTYKKSSYFTAIYTIMDKNILYTAIQAALLRSRNYVCLHRPESRF